MNLNDVEALIAELQSAAEAYYQEGEDSPLEDSEFDDKIDLLSEIYLSGDHPELFKDSSQALALLEQGDAALGTTPNSENIVRHEIPMLSLGKAKTFAEVENFVKKANSAGAHSFCLQAKLDGVAISAVYVNGRLDVVSTRGSGTIGEDSTYLAKSKGLKVVGLPLKINKSGTVEIRGEIFFTDEQFAAANMNRVAFSGEAFKNSRNAVSGIVKKAKGGMDFDVEVTFCHYAIIVDGRHADLSALPDQKYSIATITNEQVPELKISGLIGITETMAAIKKFGELRPEFTIPTDGVVVKPENEAEMFVKMGFTSHHPSSQIAFKYPGEKKQTTITNIEVTVGGTGKLTPVATFNKVHVMGSDLENVTLNNFAWLYGKGIRIGSVVMMTKANDVIPFLEHVISNPSDSSDFPIPTNCPICDSVLIWNKNGPWPPQTLRCENFECDSRRLYGIKTGVSKVCFDIDGLSTATLDALFESGRVTNIADIFTLTLDELANTATGVNSSGTILSFGKKRAQHVLDQINDAKTRPVYRILKALNIPMLGSTSSKLLIKEFGSFENLQKASLEDVAKINGLGPLRAKAIVNGLEYRKDTIDRMKKLGVVFEEIKTDFVVAAPSSAISGKAFAISGAVPEGYANRGAWVEWIESQGGIFHSGPRTGTDYMIADEDENSSKIIKAKKLGVEFVKAEDFSEKFAK